MMTRKHFEAIAKTLDANLAPLSLVSDFADMLQDENSRFDRERFIAASTNKLREDHVLSLRALDLSTGRV